MQSRPDMTTGRFEAIREMSTLAKDNQISPPSAERMAARHDRDEAAQAIKAVQTGKAPGKDGIPYEFYKYWVGKLERRTRDDPPVPDIAAMLATVWNTVPDKKSADPRYIEGLMFLLYKKKERDRAENYRPITLLNSDYKLQTKTLATRLGEIAKEAIHPDQAGFIPGRDILDHVRLAQLVKEFCDTEEVDGALVALDQEKAYDRIDHAYLWEILRGYGLPERFIVTVQALYTGAKTSVLVNQTSPNGFEVNRGVRQGDPLSCLLFNFAIEPLAELLRRSPIKGIKIPGAIRRLVVRLFTDDTQVYMSTSDKWTTVKTILDRWCLASTAKFNEGKTEFLPMGSESYRKGVVKYKCLQPTRIRTAEILPRNARFVKDRQPLRILGGQVGKDVPDEVIWEKVTENIEALAKKWSGRRITMKGRRLITSFILQSRAQYLVMTNPPPKQVVERISKATHRMMWLGKKRGLTTMDVVERPVEKGGLGTPNFKDRVVTSHLIWAKKWYAPHHERPLWALVADQLVARLAKKPAGSLASNPAAKTWTKGKKRTKKVSRMINEMLETAHRYHVRLEARKWQASVKGKLPLWDSHMTNLRPKDARAAGMKHLREYHRVEKLEDILRISPQSTDGCNKHRKCLQIVDRLTTAAAPRYNVRFATPVLTGATQADDLDHTARRKSRALKDRGEGKPFLLNPDVTHRDAPEAATRIFGTPPDWAMLPAFRKGRTKERERSIVAYTDGSTTGFGTSDAKCGAGVWSEEPGLTKSLRILSEPVTNNRAELAATVWLLEHAPPNVELEIRTDSEYVVTGFASKHAEWEDHGWLDVPNSDLWKGALYLLRSRTAETRVAKVKAHSGIKGNEKADELAKAGADLPPIDQTPAITIPAEWALHGARLQAQTFSSMYKWVRASKTGLKQTREGIFIERIQDAASKHSQRVTPADIWKSLRRDYIRREIADFMWAAIHGRSPCGPAFSNWGGEWDDLQFCKCGALESMEHILTQCGDAIWRYRLWNEAARILRASGLMPDRLQQTPSYGEVLGTGVIKANQPAGTRLWATVISETAFTIWKLRNRERFDETRISQRQAINSWYDNMERRARTDLAITTLRGTKTARESKRNTEIAAAWGSVLTLTRGAIKWEPSDHG